MQTFTKITAIIISVIMMMGIFIFSSSAEATDDYTCINGEKHSSTVSQCNNCGAFIVEVGKTIVLSVTRFENSNQFTVANVLSWYTSEGNAAIERNYSSINGFSGSGYQITEVVEIKGVSPGRDTVYAYLNGYLYTTASIAVVPNASSKKFPKTIKLSKTEYTYNGKVQTPSVIVKDSKGNTLKKDTDYTVKYESGRKLPGKYTVTVTFKGKYSGTKKLTYTIAPRVTSKVTASQTTTTITLKWNKVTGADGYRIYQYNTKTKKYEKVKDVTGTGLKISDLKSGTKYKFKVRAFTKDDGTLMGAYSPIFETATKAKTPTLKVTSTKKGVASLSWTNVTGESGYQVYYATSKNGTYKKLDSYKVNVVKGSKSKLASGKTYYFKVRAYTKTDSGTVYSAWSTVKSVKVK